MMDPYKFKAPFIKPQQAWGEADLIRKKHWTGGTLPVEVEEILWKVGLRIDPLPSLRISGDVDALLSADLTRIIVDAEEYMDDRQQNRMRFSIAHELGHFVLHKNIYRDIRFTSVEEWMDFVETLPDDQYSYIEQQAYEFAGRLLVPVDRLKKEFGHAVTRAQKAGFIDWDRSGDAAREHIATSLCRIFGVSSQVVEKRLIREGLWPLQKKS
jgi:hypothetical protein